MTRSTSFALAGGLDEASQPLAIPSGRAIACVNHEVLESGYARIDGYERFDGRTGPTDYPFWLIYFDEGATLIEAGDTITGGTSGATGVVLVDAELSEGAWDGTGAGVVGFRSLTGTFQVGEELRVGGIAYASATSVATVGASFSGDTYEESVGAAARSYARGLIQAVPGSGPIRGVWELDDTVYAFRDNVGATAGKIYKSTTSGWSSVDLGSTLTFTSGGTTEIVVGNTITGAASGATAVVRRVVLTSGSWATGDAAGTMIVGSVTGVFAAENVNVGASLNLATVAGPTVAQALPAGGRYSFVTHNFYASSGSRRVYGVNGVGTAFEFDAVSFAAIPTGAAVDTPNRIAVYRNRLALAFPNGLYQISEPDEPMGWDGTLGAVEAGIGSDIADFIPHTDALIILGKHGIFVLTGFTADDMVLGTITLEAGAKPYTGQNISGGVYLDNRGLRTIATSQNFGNFAMGTITQTVQKTLRRKAAVGATPIASAIVRTKNHYRLFFDDGTGFSFYIGRKFPEPMYFDLGVAPTCVCSNERPDGSERLLFGSADGMVYQLDKGRSFDGEDIGAYLQLSYTHTGTPTQLKRFHKVAIEATTPSACTISLAVEYDYSDNEQMATSTREGSMQGTGGMWGIANWSEFYWSGPSENVIEAEVEGQGRNASLIVHSTSDLIPAYVLRGATMFFSPRGAVR